LGIAAVKKAFDGNFIELQKFVDENNRYPRLAEIAGKAVVYFPGSSFGTLRGVHADHCVSRDQIEESIKNGNRLEGDDPNEDNPPGSGRFFRLDQYQADWPFDYGVPPNPLPLVVDFDSQPPWTVVDAQGDNWFCGDPFDPLSERGQFQVVQEAH